ncbi:MAG: FMN-binding protein [Actinomycetia bacterium]|nr:FMN-binding protein [Actinomycetes bacterium]
MRRALLTLGGTAAGLAALLSFKTHSLAAADPAASAPATSAAGTSQPMASGASPAAGTAAPKTGAAPKASASIQAATRTVTGTVANTQYGPMQVQVTLAGTKITKATVLQRTNDGAESDQIDATAIPQLTSETLAAQSARVDAVSGASYTSSGYIQSLQSALDKANA